MYYHIRHLTRFRYSAPVSESVMEVRMQPRSDGSQRLHTFQMTTIPRATLFSYRDVLGNVVHHFDVPGRHKLLTIIAEALVEALEPPPLPRSTAMPGSPSMHLLPAANSGRCSSPAVLHMQVTCCAHLQMN